MATPTPLPVQRAARDIGQHLVAWRKLRGLIIKQVADRAGVSDKTVSRLATDPGSISLENLLRIARALGILDSLVTAADPSAPTSAGCAPASSCHSASGTQTLVRMRDG